MSLTTPASINYRRNAVWVLGILISAELALMSLTLVFRDQVNALAPQAAGLRLMTNVVALLISGVSLWLNYRRHTSTAVCLALAGATGIAAAVIVGSKGVGVVVLGALIVAWTLIFLLTVPLGLALWAIALTTLFAVVGFAYDLWGPTRPAADVSVLLPIIGGALLLFSGVFASQFRWFPLGVKLTLLGAFIAVTPMVILGYLYDQSLRGALTLRTYEALNGGAAQVAATLDAFIDAQLKNVNVEARLPVLGDFLSLPAAERLTSPLYPEVQRTLRTLSLRPHVSSYALLDLSGLNVADTAARSLDPNEAEMDYFKQALDLQEAYVSYAQLSKATGQLSLFFSAPVVNAERRTVGVLRVRFNAQALQSIVADANGLLGAGSFAALVDDYGLFLGHGEQAFLVNHAFQPLTPERFATLQANGHLPPRGAAADYVIDLPTLAAAWQAIDTQSYFFAEFHDANDSLDAAAVYRMTTRPWVVIMVQPLDAFLGTVEAQTQLAVSFGGLIAVVSVALAIVVAQTFAAPINQLATAARQLATGNLQTRVAVNSADEIGALTTAFNTMADELQATLTNLETRIDDRTRALATSAAISRRLSTLLREDELLRELVIRVQADFNYYYVQIYLLDEANALLRLAYGSGAVGPLLMSRGHSLPLGRGLVGRAAETNAPVVVPDVTREAQWLPNPLLPLTRAEAAVPISLGERVMGVLDVQHSQAAGLQTSDADVLRTIANQAAIALRNARTYAATQRDAERKLLISTIGERVRASVTAEEALQVAARELAYALQVEQVVAQLRPNSRAADDHRE
jgi:putative methionine-R-sulfoxide reductase with GAF domain